MTTPNPYQNGRPPSDKPRADLPRQLRYPRNPWVPQEMVEEDRRQTPEPRPATPDAPSTTYIGRVRPPVPNGPPLSEDEERILREANVDLTGPPHPETVPARAVTPDSQPGLATEIFSTGGLHRAPDPGRRVNVHRQRLILIAACVAVVLVIVLSIVLMRLGR
jgi:hypothetical protein